MFINMKFKNSSFEGEPPQSVFESQDKVSHFLLSNVATGMSRDQRDSFILISSHCLKGVIPK